MKYTNDIITSGQVFSGRPEYLDPHSNPAPMIRLPDQLNPFHADNVDVYMKTHSGPQNIKILPAWQMLSFAQEAGDLKGVKTAVVPSSGNMALMFHTLAPLFGIEEVIGIVGTDTIPQKMALFKFHGLTVEQCMSGSPLELGRNMVEGRPDRLLFDQYSSPSNVAAHRTMTGPQILTQTEGAITILSAGLGSTATLVGTSQCLRHKLPKGQLTTIGVMLEEGNSVPGLRSESRLSPELIKFDWRKEADRLVKVTAVQSYRLARMLTRFGISAGPSTGAALYGALLEILKIKIAGELDKHRFLYTYAGGLQYDGKVVVVVPSPEPFEIYLEKCQKVLADAGIPDNEPSVITIDDLQKK